MKKLFKVLLVMTLILTGAGSAFAVSSYLTSFNSTYPGVTTINTCTLCHTSAPARNPYGDAFRNSGHNFRTIESLDSDGDGFSNITEINARTFPGNAASKPATTVACTGYTYSAWSACGSNGQQTRTVTGNTPAGCTGTPATSPVLTQACTPTSVVCTSFTYSAWGACQSNNTQTRTVVSSSPAGCTGGTPVLTQSCVYVPPTTACTGYTYSAWSACGTNGQQTRTVTGNTPAGCTGTPATSPVLTQACTPTSVVCTSFTYSAWGACQSNNTQTRTVVSSSPAGCTGGTPVLTQSCVYIPPTTACTGYTYSAWSACGTNGQQTRTVTGNTPAGCTGTPTTSPVLTQACSPTTSVVMPVPTSRQFFSYDPVAVPVRNAKPSAAKPVGVGAVATGGATLTLQVAASFAGPVDMYLLMYTPGEGGGDDDDEAPVRVLSLGRDGVFRSVDGYVAPWKRNVTAVNQKVLVDVPVAELATGTYKVLLKVRPAGSTYRYYQWSTYFIVD